jgi:hypothetical protein
MNADDKQLLIKLLERRHNVREKLRELNRKRAELQIVLMDLGRGIDILKEDIICADFAQGSFLRRLLGKRRDVKF